MSNELPIPEDRSQNVLTGIPQPLQCPAASEGVDPATEADEAAVKALIETLARVAHAVAARKAQDQQERNGQ